METLDLFFKLTVNRYEKSSIIITSIKKVRMDNFITNRGWTKIYEKSELIFKKLNTIQ